MAIVWLDGRYLPESRARIPATDPGVCWGAGLFEVLRAYNGRPFRASQHEARLEASARQFGIAPRVPDLERVVPRLLARNRLEGGYVRVTLTAGGHCVIEARAYAQLPRTAQTRGVRLEVAPWRRDPAAPLAGHKTLAYWELVLAREHAERGGAVDAVLLDPAGYVLEGARASVLLVDEGVLVTPRSPKTRRGILPGVTGGVVREIASRARIRRASRAVTLEELARSDEVLVTSTMMEVVPVSRIGRVALGTPGPITRRLAAAFRELVEEECPPGRPRTRRR